MSVADKITRLAEHPEAKLCFAIPGQTMIDEINPNTGLGVYSGHTLEQVQERYPGAQIMEIDEYCRSKAAAQDTAVVWIETTREEYDNMLGCLPPAAHNSRGFLVGEPWDHHALTGRPRYAAFIEKTTRGDGWRETRYYRASRPMTTAEFAALDLKGGNYA